MGVLTFSQPPKDIDRQAAAYSIAVTPLLFLTLL
jgi:hypothetical protein